MSEILLTVFGGGTSTIEVDAESATTFQFFPSYSMAAKSMDAERRLCFFEAIEIYGCYGVEPGFLFAGDGWLESAFEAMRVSLDRSRKGCINGRKGGRPRKKAESKSDTSCAGKMQEDESSADDDDGDGPVENSGNSDGEGVLTLSEKGLKGFGNGFKPKEKKRKESNKEKKSNSNSANQQGDGPDIQYLATPSRDELRAEAAARGFVSVDLDAFAESLPSMPPGTEWRAELAAADLAAWEEKHGAAMEAVV